MSIWYQMEYKMSLCTKTLYLCAQNKISHSLAQDFLFSNFCPYSFCLCDCWNKTYSKKEKRKQKQTNKQKTCQTNKWNSKHSKILEIRRTGVLREGSPNQVIKFWIIDPKRNLQLLKINLWQINHHSCT